jgi:hypothetical protein
MNKKTIIILGIVAFVAVGLVAASTLFLTQTNQDNRSSADEPTPPIIPPSVSPVADTSFGTSTVDTTTPTPTDTLTPTATPTVAPQTQQTSCQQPSQVTNVKVTYPYIDSNGTAQFVQAGCSWDANADATSYTLTVTEVETNTVVLNQSEPAGTTQVAFNINQGKTYRCDVSAVNSCGAVSVAASDQLLCSADGLVNPTPTITEAPTASPTATLPPATETPRPTLPPTGPAYSMIIGVAAAVGIILFGGILFIL